MERLWLRLHVLFATFFFCLATPNPRFGEQALITAPPNPQRTSCPHGNVLKRQEACEFGSCGSTCLSQGAFCCGPAGTVATSPFWVCDNGACITSVRGTTGVVDCYDPDNPSGTTQSCIDNVPTTTCKPTDRCYTCNTYQPFCRWETYIADNQPTLSWFSCVETRLPDTTFFAATITTDLATTGKSTSSPTTQASEDKGDSVLPIGAIVGIAVGGTLVIVGMAALLVYCCMKKRKRKPEPPQELNGKSATKSDTLPISYQPPAPTELDAQSCARSELNSASTHSPRSQPISHSPHSQPISPFTPVDGGRGNFEGINMWRGGYVPSEPLPPQSDYFTQAPRELHGDTAEKRTSWGYGDDQIHMSPTTMRH